MPAPALAVLRQTEQIIDDFLQGLGGLIGYKCLDLFRLGRQANQIEVNAADERAAVGIRDGAEIPPLEAIDDVAVNLRPRPDGILALGRNHLDRLEGPMLAGVNLADLATDRRAVAGPWVWRAHFHPLHQVGDGGIRELFLRRHLHAVQVSNGLNQQTLVGLAGNEGRAAFATLANAILGIQPQLALQFLGGGAVALVAVGNQHRADFLLEKVVSRRAAICRGCNSRGQDKQERGNNQGSHRGDSAGLD